MPSTEFICPDNIRIKITDCMNKCRMEERCAPMPYLEQIAFDREWRGITASMAGNGIRLIWLQKVRDYAISPDSMAFAVHGIGTHDTLSRADFNKITEERLPEGTADLLEIDTENSPPPGTFIPVKNFKDKIKNPNKYILTDYKTWGSYKVASALGIVKNKETKQFEIDESTIDLRGEEYQLNSYRIGFERCGFPISKMRIFAIIRDGGTYVAKGRGILTNTKFINVNRLTDNEVVVYYNKLHTGVQKAEEVNYAPICSPWEAWDYRRCDGYCNVSEFCEELSIKHKEPTWKDLKKGGK